MFNILSTSKSNSIPNNLHHQLNKSLIQLGMNMVQNRVIKPCEMWPIWVLWPIVGIIIYIQPSKLVKHTSHFSSYYR